MLLAIPFPDLSPTLISVDIGSFTLAIRWYALAYIAGVIIGYAIVKRAIDRPALWPGDTAPMSRKDMEDLVTWMILGIIIGGRLGYVLFYDRAYYMAHPLDIPKVWIGGMAFHGGFLGVVVAAAIFAHLRGIPKLQLADALAVATPAGLMLGRIANFINAELWGRPTDVPWGVIFPGQAAQNCPGVEGLCARHPSQLYEAGLEGLVLGILLLWLVFARGWLKTPGAVLGVFLAGYGAARFFVEFYRVADAQFVTADSPAGRVLFIGDFGLSMGQALSTPMIIVGLALLIWARRRA